MINMEKRPEVTNEMIRAAAMEAAKILGGNVNDIVDVYEHPMDGFELALALVKEHGWVLNRSDMEMLDGIEDALRGMHDELVKEWVQKTFPVPPLAIGTQTKSGEITGVYEHTPGYFCIKRPGHNDDTDGYSRLLVPFEDAVAA